MEAWGKALNFARRAAALALWSLEFAEPRFGARRLVVAPTSGRRTSLATPLHFAGHVDVPHKCAQND